VAVTVSIPTILRSHTGGAKTVDVPGGTLAEVIDNLDSQHSGLKARLISNGSLHRFVNVYINDEDVRFAGGLDASVSDGDTVTILPAVAGGAMPTVGGGAALPAVGGGAILPAITGGAAILPAVADG
jgi:sulfur-carrier protein